MPFLSSRMRSVLGGAGAVLALAVPMAGQANAATVRLHAATATGESLQGPSFFGTSVFLAATNLNASNQKWVKTDVGGGYATYRSLGGTNQPMCLAASSLSSRPFAAICNASSFSQQWTRGFVNDGRIENRSTFTALTRQSNGVLEVRFLGGGQVGQNWHEHVIG
jgi:hypothetical protein